MSNIAKRQPQPAKNVKLYRNGDAFFTGRKFVINKRQINNMDTLCGYATEMLKPRFGAVRNIYTPEKGTKIYKIDQLESGNSYVVGGFEPFKNLPSHRKYTDIGKTKPVAVKKTYSHIKPVNHNKNLNSVQCRWKSVANEINHPIQIWLHVNGDNNSRPIKFLLPSRILKLNWDILLEYITDRVGHRLGNAVRRLSKIDGTIVPGVKDLENGCTYVACGSEKFKQMIYSVGGHGPSKSKPIRVPIKQHVNNYDKKQYDDILTTMQAQKNQKALKAIQVTDLKTKNPADQAIFKPKMIAKKVKELEISEMITKKGKDLEIFEDTNTQLEITGEKTTAKTIKKRK